MVTRLSFLKTVAKSESRESRSVPLLDAEVLDSEREGTRKGR